MEIEIQFPVIRYFPNNRRAETPVVMVLRKSKKELYRVGRWPRKEWFVPGGILDSRGRDIPILDLVNWRPIPKALKPIDYVLGGLIVGGYYCVEFVLGEPKQLTLQEFKDSLCRLVAKQRSFYSSGVGYRAIQRDVQAATSFEEAVRAV